MRALVALVFCVSLLAGALGQVAEARRLLAAPNEQQFRKVWEQLPEKAQEQIGGYFFLNQPLADRQRTLRAYLKDSKWGDAATTTKVKDARAEAKRILVPPSYRPRDLNPPARSGNWLGDTLSRFGEMVAEVIRRILEFLGRFMPRFGAPAAGGTALAAVIPIVQVLVILAAIALVIFALRFIKVRRRAAAVGQGLLSDEEAALPADEWLKRADQLAQEGQHRQAVRCLYLACLVRFDEHGIIPLRREETNWEHLRRLDKSRTRPADLNFREATSKFDTVWYGERTKGMEDVAWFRSQYESVMQAIRQRRSA